MSEELTGGDRSRALIDAYRLLDRAQRTCDPIDVASAAIRARRRHWSDVEFVLHYARYAQAELTGADMAGPLAHMETMAERADDPALDAVVGACQAQRAAADVLDAELAGHASLTAAVALLDGGAGSSVHRPAAWIECALAYRTLGLWELEEDLLAAAADDLDRPWPPGLEPIRRTSQRGVWINRVEARAQRVCELLELGERSAAAALARDGATTFPVTLDGEDDGGPDDAWPIELAFIRSVLDAAAGRPDPGYVARPRTDWSWPGYPSCLDLAAAIRADDAGDPVGAAARAEAALVGMDQDCLPALRLLALAIAGNRPPVSPPARRYARELAELRTASRHRVLRAAQLQRSGPRPGAGGSAPESTRQARHGGRGAAGPDDPT